MKIYGVVWTHWLPATPLNGIGSEDTTAMWTMNE